MRLLSKTEVAHILDVSTETVTRLVAERLLGFVEVRGRAKFKPEHVDEYVRRHERPAVVEQSCERRRGHQFAFSRSSNLQPNQ